MTVLLAAAEKIWQLEQQGNLAVLWFEAMVVAVWGNGLKTLGGWFGTKFVSGIVSWGLLTGGATAYGQRGMRTLKGKVTDRHHEPLRGAIVQVENEQTGAVASYITDRQGSYSFKHLSQNDDYKVWATYRSQRSGSREITHFDSKPEKVIGLTIKLEY